MNNENNKFDRNNRITQNYKKNLNRSNNQNTTANKLREKISSNQTKNLLNRNRKYIDNQNEEDLENNNEKSNVGIKDKMKNFISSDNKGGLLKNKAKTATNKAKDKAKDKAKEAAKKAAKTVIKTIVRIIITNPLSWVIIGIFLLIIMVPILWGVYDSDGSDGSGDNLLYISGYEGCSSITVEGSGTYNLEDYVAGVVEHEGYISENIEALKAQAVAARTYAINATNNCKNSIGNSQASQTFSTNPSDKAKTAATETAGQVLTYDNKIFSAMYDSFCYSDSDCADSVKNPDGTYTVTYHKLPNNEEHKINLTDSTMYNKIVPGGGHAKGMSQLVSYQMAKSGKKYDDILKYFYSDGVKISTIIESQSTLGEFNNDFLVRGSSNKPNWLIAPDNTYYNTQINGNYWFECVWYAKSRAYEILASIKNPNTARRNQAIEALMNSHGNGADWYNNSQNGGTMSIFASSNDYTKPRPGAMISWKWTTSHWRAKNTPVNYGHVAIVESVDSNARTAVISDGWSSCREWNNTSCFNYRSQTVSFDYIKNFGGNYDFLGYVYLTDYVKGG